MSDLNTKPCGDAQQGVRGQSAEGCWTYGDSMEQKISRITIWDPANAVDGAVD